MKEKELLFSVGPKDFKWDFFKTSGPGGQNKNKRDTVIATEYLPIRMQAGGITPA